MKNRISLLVVISAISCNITNSGILAQEAASIKETELMPSAAAKQVDLDIENEYVVALFMETLKAIDDTRSDLEEIMAALREGKIAMWNNKGAWMAVLEKGTILKAADFSSEDMNSRIIGLEKTCGQNLTMKKRYMRRATSSSMMTMGNSLADSGYVTMCPRRAYFAGGR